MGNRPGIGFKTNVKDEKLAEKIATRISEEFDVDEEEGCLRFNGWSLTYAVLSGGYDEYLGMSADSLVFSYRDDEWSEWTVFRERGEKIREIATFVDEEFEYVTVESVKPIIPYR